LQPSFSFHKFFFLQPFGNCPTRSFQPFTPCDDGSINKFDLCFAVLQKRGYFVQRANFKLGLHVFVPAPRHGQFRRMRRVSVLGSGWPSRPSNSGDW
jgi:hypothetical protein